MFKYRRGFTLIESIIVMVIMGIAMMTLFTFLYPQVESSARSYYQTRAAHLGKGILTQILSKGFDNNSDFDGGDVRCGENNAPSCSLSLGRDGNEQDAQHFNDVDDYIGCWWTVRESDCSSNAAGGLNDLLGADAAKKYANFTVTIRVHYVNTNFSPVSTTSELKQVELDIQAGRHGSYQFTGYKGNY